MSGKELLPSHWHLFQIRKEEVQLLIPWAFVARFIFPLFTAMAKIQKKGKKGAAATFITRQQALKKLQISLADFRLVNEIGNKTKN